MTVVDGTTGPARSPLVLVSGMLCDEAVWAPTVALLRDIADVRVVTLGTVDSVAEMAERVLFEAPAGFALAGHSLGGRVALEVVRQAPHRVQRLALLGTAYRARPPGEAGQAEASARAAMLAQAESDGLDRYAQQWVRRMIHARWATETAAIRPLTEMVAGQGLDALRAQVKMGLSRPDFTEFLPRIGCPTLVLASRNDAAMPLGPHEEMAAAIPGARLVVVEDAGHLFMFEQPQVCATAMTQWLSAPPARFTR